MSDPFTCNRIVKQGSVLSSNICSTSTAEICDQNLMGFATVGDTVINDILYVDDTTDPNTGINETVDSHYEIDNFTKSKRMSMNYTKCCILGFNMTMHDSIPTLLVDDNPIPHASKTKSVGDVINDKGTNKDLIEDRIKKEMLH